MGFKEALFNIYGVLTGAIDVQDQVEDRRDQLRQYMKDDSQGLVELGSGPNVAVYPRTELDLVNILRHCNRNLCPIVPWGAGTSLQGQIQTCGGICMSFQRMKDVLRVNEKDLDVVVQPGITVTELNEHLKPMGLYYPVICRVDNCTVGGMVSTSASGPSLIRYSTIKDTVLSLRVVLPSGHVVKTGNRARKTAAGYDLTHLFIGSEGTLGVISEVTLRIARIPRYTRFLTVAFDVPMEATDFACHVMGEKSLNIDVDKISTMELLDPLMVRGINNSHPLDLPEKYMVLIELQSHTTIDVLDATIDGIERVAQAMNAETTIPPYAQAEAMMERIGADRQALALAAVAPSPTSTPDVLEELKNTHDVWTADVCVPITQVGRFVGDTERDAASLGICSPISGFVGDGQVHVFIVVEKADKALTHRARSFRDGLLERAIELEGTCSGKFGIGSEKREFLRKELGDGATSLMKEIKTCLDPNGILNPGKVVCETWKPVYEPTRTIAHQMKLAHVAEEMGRHDAYYSRL